MPSETVQTSKGGNTGVDTVFSGAKEPKTSIISVWREIESGEDGMTVQSQYFPKIPEGPVPVSTVDGSTGVENSLTAASTKMYVLKKIKPTKLF